MYCVEFESNNNIAPTTGGILGIRVAQNTVKIWPKNIRLNSEYAINYGYSFMFFDQTMN